MDRRTVKIDLVKLIRFVLKRSWLIVLCAEIGFGAMYIRTTRFMPDTYTASGTMYVNNGNPNVEQYQYTNSSDLDSAVKLIDTYLIVVKSEKVMKSVVAQLSNDYPGIQAGYISSSLSMASVSETGVAAVRSRTNDAKLSKDIVNAVLDAAPEEIIRVVGAGKIEIIDYAIAPMIPDSKGALKKGILGAMASAVLAGCVLLVMFLMNQRITDTKDLTDNYTPPVLASIQRIKEDSEKAGTFLLTNTTDMGIVENYAKLRMNLLYTLVGKETHAVIITSAVAGEGKSTIAANLAISCAMGDKKVLLVDGDLRRASQSSIFELSDHTKGMSEVLVGASKWQDMILKKIKGNVDLLPAGHFPPNPAELLGSNEMLALLKELEQAYDLVLLDMPPINIVSDPLVLSNSVAGCIFVTRQDYSDHREIRKALIEAEMAGMNVMGFVFYGEDIKEAGYYSKKYYNKYYSKYEYRRNPVDAAASSNGEGIRNADNELQRTEKGTMRE